jgi:thiol-disulfide isomerase/thioredoxin
MRTLGALGGLAVAGFLAVVAGLFAAAPAAAQAGEGQVSLALGTQAPDAEVQDLDENAVSLLDYVDGKPTLIEFWATWCELCAALQPQLDEIHATYGERLNIVAVAVAVSQSLRRVRRAVEAAGHGYPFLWDARGAAVRAYQAPTTSVIVIVDAEGKVAYTGVGAEQDLIGAVERLLAGS